jgi:[ribosomal protein S18]-alanine N-acetyltransferase
VKEIRAMVRGRQMQVCVRVGRVGDLAAIAALERGVAEAPHWGEAEYAAVVDRADRQSEGGGVRRCLFVAQVGGRVMGFAVGKVVGVGSEGVGELESVVVDAGGRRSGLGMALCVAVAGWSREQGAAAVELEVRAGSAGAIALYRRLGFVEGGRRRGYYRAPDEDAVLMRLELVAEE